MKKSSTGPARTDFWPPWRDSDFSWQGLAKDSWDGETIDKPWDGWVVCDDGLVREAATGAIFGKAAPDAPSPASGRKANLQDYWRADPSTGRLRSDNEMGEELIAAEGQPTYHVAHLPFAYEDGTPTGKAGWPKGSLDPLIKSRLAAASISGGKRRSQRRATASDRRARFDGGIWPYFEVKRLFVDNKGAEAKRSISVAFDTSIFFGEASFEDTRFAGDAGFSNTKFSDGGEFGKAHFAGDADFMGANFNGDANFNEAQFSRVADFQGASFDWNADFERSEFARDASFQTARFEKVAKFEGVKFTGNVDFREAEFTGGHIYSDALFADAEFNGEADFTSAQFISAGVFSNAYFAGDVFFERSKFLRDADFTEAFFCGRAYFPNAVFDCLALFDDAVFRGDMSFVGARFEKKASFRGITWVEGEDAEGKKWRQAEAHWRGAFFTTEFKGAADFAGAGARAFSAFDDARLEGGIIFDNPKASDVDAVFRKELRFHVNFPQLAAEEDLSDDLEVDGEEEDSDDGVGVGDKQAEADGANDTSKSEHPNQDRQNGLAALESGCRVLKQAMAASSNTLREQQFYRYELLARRKQKATPWSEKLFSHLYDWTANYGASIGRPFVAVLTVVVLFACAYWLAKEGFGHAGAAFAAAPNGELDPAFRSAIMFSASRVFPFGAFEDVSKEWIAGFGPADSLRVLLLRIVASLQSSFALALVFVFGLAVRRKFQIN